MAKEAYDPYELAPDAVKEPPPGLGRAMLQIGPGLILAGSIVGTGELIATTNLGAKVGFVFLWLVLISCFIKVFVQVELGRHAISSGETTLTSLQRLPGPGSWMTWWWLIMMLATQAQLAAMVGMVGQAIHMVVPEASATLAGSVGLDNRPGLPWAALTAAATALLLAVGSYRLVERGTTLLVVVFTLMTVACVAFLPGTGHAFSWSDIASGLTLQIPPNAVADALMMFGITGVGASELFAYPYWCIEKGYARNIGPRNLTPQPQPPFSAPSEGGAGGGRGGQGPEVDPWLQRARGWLRVMKLDAWVCMLVYTVATLAFFFLGAAVLFPKVGGVGLKDTSVATMLQLLAHMYEPVLGAEGALWFIVIGVFAVLYSTLFAATAANSRTLVDFLRVNGFIRLAQPEDRRHWVRLFCVAFPLLYLTLFVFVPKPLLLVTVGGIAQAVTLPLIGSAAVYLRYRRTDRRLTPGLFWDAFLWLSLLGLFVAAGYGLWDPISKLLKQE